MAVQTGPPARPRRGACVVTGRMRQGMIAFCRKKQYNKDCAFCRRSWRGHTREKRGTDHESEGTQRAAAAVPRRPERHQPGVRLLCERERRDHLLHRQLPGGHASGGVGKISGAVEEIPLRHPGKEPHRHRFLHPAGGRQRGAPAPHGPAGLRPGRQRPA